MLYGHLAHFAGSDEDALLARVTKYFLTGLAREGILMIVSSCERRDAMLARLPADAPVRWLDSSEVLEAVYKNGRVDAHAFDDTVGKEMRQLLRHYGARPVYAFGDIVSLLWDKGDHSAAADFEWYLNDLGSTIPFHLFCAYHIGAGQTHHHDVRQIARMHSHIIA